MCDGRKKNSLPVCPRAGKLRLLCRRLRRQIKCRIKGRWFKWLFPITGLIATIWFLVRVLPKPSRATYPCQRVAFPLASSFVAYILGLLGTAVALRRARRRLAQSRYVLAGLCILVGLGSAWLTISINSRSAVADPFVPLDPPNSPMGVARGLSPGRVVWVHDPDSTYWDPAWNNSYEIFYWDDDHTDQAVVDQMMSNAVRWLTSEVNDETAWNKLFRYFNQTHGRGDVGYRPGEKIAIKPNHVEHRRHNYEFNYADLCPQMLVALLKQLVWQAGVDESCITICDSSRYIADKTFNRCYALFPEVTYAETNYYTGFGDDQDTDPRRPSVQPSAERLIIYSGINSNGNPIPSDYVPMPFVEADYVINFAIMKGHSSGITLCGKNWYGCFCDTPRGAHHDLLNCYQPDPNSYRPMVDLMGHEHLGGKTMLYIHDGLWGFPCHGQSSSSRPTKWQNSGFNNDYPSSILMSQDGVAIDSVGLDFLRAEFGDNLGLLGWASPHAVDDYLHEAALANDPPSGKFYDPNHPIGDPDAIRLSSLGVHEHWNNPVDKQYSRNFGTAGEGVELISSVPVECTAALDGDVNGDCRVDYTDLYQMATEWLADGDSNLDNEGDVDMRDFAILAEDWRKCNLAPQSLCW